VLLKNDRALLPLDPKTATIAVIGPLADNKLEPLGPWHTLGQAEDVVTVLQGIRARASAAQVVYAPGAGIEDTATRDSPPRSLPRSAPTSRFWFSASAAT